MDLRTCVSPKGCFVLGIHEPCFEVTNFRENDRKDILGASIDGKKIENQINFPPEDIRENGSDPVFEIPNAFPFRGTTYIKKSWADNRASDIESIKHPEIPEVSLHGMLKNWHRDGILHTKNISDLIPSLPKPLLTALASTSTDPEDLIRLAEISCEFIKERKTGNPTGIRYIEDSNGVLRPLIHDHALFEVIANNPMLPDNYKKIMVLRPGAQGNSEIVGDWNGSSGETGIFEYLRRNSYIPWGHYAANMSDRHVRYRIQDLTYADMTGLRHLYYQRTYTRLARYLNIRVPDGGKALLPDALEELRKKIVSSLPKYGTASFDAELWGWNFGFDFTPTGYRLHGSHQQVHQQYALIPTCIPAICSESTSKKSDEKFRPYSAGDLITNFITRYHRKTGHSFFEDYIAAIRTNHRIDGNTNSEHQELVIHQEGPAMLFVPKAQTSQWELQVMAIEKAGNVLEADREMRGAIDRLLLIAVKVLTALGARMITSIEYSKRFSDLQSDQRLIYSILPKMPNSPGSFTEAQLRFIVGHYPEDFAAACRFRLPELIETLEN